MPQKIHSVGRISHSNPRRANKKAEFTGLASYGILSLLKEEGAGMDAVVRTRRCCRTRDERKNQPFRTSKQICLAMTREAYDRIWDDPAAVRGVVAGAAGDSP